MFKFDIPLLFFLDEYISTKQGPKGPQKLSSLNHLKFKTPSLKIREFAIKPSEMASLSNYR